MSVTLSGDDPKLYFNDGTVQQTAGVPNNGPCFSTRKTGANQSVATTAFVKITFDTPDYVYDADISSSRFTPTVPGVYHFTGAVNWAASAPSATRAVVLFKNGARACDGDFTTTAGTVSSIVSGDIYLNGAGDYVELHAYQNSGSAQNVIAFLSGTYFQGHLVRAL